jgi:hypothetical protein
MEINLGDDIRNFGVGGVFLVQHNPQNTMKSNILAMSAAAAGTAFVAVAVLAALTADYGRNIKSLGLRS